MKLSLLWAAPEVNPINHKARSVPFLNPLNVYGRAFFFSWFGFMIAFWACIRVDLGLTPAQIANSNIVSICATLLVRLCSGTLCDAFGPRVVFGCLLLVGAIPVGLSPTISTASHLYAVRFFGGILGGTFVPCQVWSTGFFDKNVVGLANALTGGWGNAGGGITYFIMPSIDDSLAQRGYSRGEAWRITFVVPLILVLVTGVCLLAFCPDTPTGKWSERHLHVQQNLVSHGVPDRETKNDSVSDVPGGIADRTHSSGASPPRQDEESKESKPQPYGDNYDHEAQMTQAEMFETAEGEVVVKPSLREGLAVFLSLQTAFQMLAYACSFGGELAINSILASYYTKNFPYMSQQLAGNWAAMFGFLNVVTRPLGGFVADFVYRASGHSLWAKKAWIVVCGVLTGACLIIIGTIDPHNQHTFTGLIALMAIFLEAGNGANFALVPHVHPFANGVVSGCTGGGGNFGGIIFLVIFRFMGRGTDYAKAFWIIGIIHVAVNLGLSWIRPIPKGQIGGH